jgi:hypothetical protein
MAFLLLLPVVLVVAVIVATSARRPAAVPVMARVSSRDDALQRQHLQ